MVFKIQPLILLCVFIGIFLQMEVVLPQDDTNTDTADTNQQDENTSTEHWKPPKEDGMCV